MPTKTQVVGARPQTLLDMVNGWKPFMATEESTAETYRGHVERPGGQPWEGTTADAATGVARGHHAAVADARDTVDEGVRDIGNTISTELIPPLTNAQQIIANAEAQTGVTVNEDLSITYTPPEGTSEATADRNRKTIADAAKELKEEADKWWAAEQTVQSQITTLRGKLDGTIPPEGAAPPGSPLTMVGPFAVPPAVAAAAQQQAGQPVPGQPPAGQLPPGQVGPFPVPPAVAAGANAPGAAPVTKLAGDDSGLAARLGADNSLEAPAAGQPGGLPAALGNVQPPIGPQERPRPGSAAVDPNSPQGKQIAAARESLLASGRSPEEVERAINNVFHGAEQNYTPPPGPPPEPDTRSLGEKLGDKFNNFVNEAHDQFYNRLDSTVNTAQNLTGLGGAGHPGVLESWQQLGEAAVAQHMEDPLNLRSPVGPLGPWGAVNGVVHDIPEMIDNPGKHAGNVLFDATAAAATAPLGAEALLGKSLLPEVGALERGLVSEGSRTLEHGAPPLVPHTPELPAVPRTAEASPVPHSDEPGTPHNAEPHPIPHTVDHPLRPAEEILHEARDAHRAERDQMDWDRGEQNLRDLAAHHGVSVDELPRTPQYDIDHSTYTDKHAADFSDEIERQTRLWEHGYNTQSVQQVLDNMDTPRQPTTDLRNDLREGLSSYGYEDLIKAGYSAADARRLATEYSEAQFPSGSGGLIPQPVIHNPDGAGGGYTEAFTYGDWQVNNALGTLTKQEKDALRAWLQTQPRDAIVNIRLIRGGGG